VVRDFFAPKPSAQELPDKKKKQKPLALKKGFIPLLYWSHSLKAKYNLEKKVKPTNT